MAGWEAPTQVSTGCCIVGGGPAGMMLGYLLARAGVAVTVLEKHPDFLRDFRGDTVHPSTMEVMWQLGLLDHFLKLPHERVEVLSAQVGDDLIRAANFRHLPTHARFIAMMPQWDFLNFLAARGSAFPEFRLMMRTEAVDLVRANDRVRGVLAHTPEGALEITAPLVIGTDGRHSTVREKAGLKVVDLGAPMDVLWMRLPRHPGDEGASLGRAAAGHIFVMIPRGDYFQCGYVVAKGEAGAIQARGLDAFRREIGEIAPMLRDRTDALRTWDDVRLLSVAVDRLERWFAPGVLCIGDAAHAMSPVGGVGINLAIQDAVATANLLYAPLRAGAVADADLERVQRRREWPTKVTQSVQTFIQRRAIAPTLAGSTPRAPAPLRLLNAIPWLRRIPARAVGLGARFEAVRSPDVHLRAGVRP
ncbi:MAG: FAD-dependent oxidoreductase [Caulobacterales bacterium]